MAPEEPDVYGNSEKSMRLRRSGIKVRNQMSLLRSSSPFRFVTINIGLLRSQEMAKLQVAGLLGKRPLILLQFLPASPSDCSCHSFAFLRDCAWLRVASRDDTPHNSTVLARDHLQTYVRRDLRRSSEDGCAFQLIIREAAFAKFNASWHDKQLSEFRRRSHERIPAMPALPQ